MEQNEGPEESCLELLDSAVESHEDTHNVCVRGFLRTPRQIILAGSLALTILAAIGFWGNRTAAVATKKGPDGTIGLDSNINIKGLKGFKGKLVINNNRDDHSTRVHAKDSMVGVGVKQLKSCEGSSNDGSGAGVAAVVCCSTMKGAVECAHDSSGQGRAPATKDDLNKLHSKGLLGEQAFREAMNHVQGHTWFAAGSATKRVYVRDVSHKFAYEKTLDDATGYIHSVAFSERYLAAGSRDGKVRLYDSSNDFELVKTLDDTTDSISSVAFSERYLAAGSWDDKVRLYDSSNDFELVKTLDDATWAILSVAFSERYLAAGGYNTKVRLYDSRNDFELVKTLDDATRVIRSVAFSERYLAAGGNDNKVRLYDSSNDFELVKTLDEGTGTINSVAFSERYLVAGSDDYKVRFYDSQKDFKLSKTVNDATDSIMSVAFSR